MGNPKHFVVRLFAICGMLVCASAMVGWPPIPPMSAPTAGVLIIYGIVLCILSNGPNGGGGATT